MRTAFYVRVACATQSRPRPIEQQLGRLSKGRRGSIAEGRSGYEQMLNDIADGRVGAVFFLEPSRVTRDIAAWHNFIKICQQVGTLVLALTYLLDFCNTTLRAW